MEPSQTTNTESKVTKPAELVNATRRSQDPSEPSGNPSNLMKQAAPPLVEAANSVCKDAEQHSTRPRALVTEGMFFIGSPERKQLAAKKIDKGDELGFYREFIKKCALCKKDVKPDKDVYMYNDHPFCSLDCRDDRIALDGFSRKDSGLPRKIKR